MIHRSPAEDVTFAKGCAGRHPQQRNPGGLDTEEKSSRERSEASWPFGRDVFGERGRLKRPGRQGAAGKPALGKPQPSH